MNDLKEFDLLKYHNNYGGNLLLTYKGPIDEYLIHSVGMYIKDITLFNLNTQKKFYKVFMELIQNVSFYSHEVKIFENGKKVGIGSLVLYKLGDDYYLNIGNKVEKEQIKPIIEKCEAINSMDREELREFKRNERSKPYSSEGGGNIGLIQVALTSKNPLNFELIPIENEISFFSVCIKINGK